MNDMSRRQFAKTFSGSAIFLWCPSKDIGGALFTNEAGTQPEEIAGLVLTGEQHELVRTFMEGYNRMMSSAREIRLENSLPPAIQFVSPQMAREKK